MHRLPEYVPSSNNIPMTHTPTAYPKAQFLPQTKLLKPPAEETFCSASWPVAGRQRNPKPRVERRRFDWIQVQTSHHDATSLLDSLVTFWDFSKLLYSYDCMKEKTYRASCSVRLASVSEATNILRPSFTSCMVQVKRTARYSPSLHIIPEQRHVSRPDTCLLALLS